jgi:hypothetical protein
MSFLYGGAALTLDEFALLLNLKDVYWNREVRASIDAIILFGPYCYRHSGKSLVQSLSARVGPLAASKARRY